MSEPIGIGAFPARRPRRLRKSEAIRSLISETTLRREDLVAPLFVREGIAEPLAVRSLPGVYQHTVASLVGEAKHLLALGIRAVVVFGVPEQKDATGSGASADDGIVQRAVEAVKESLSDELVVITDLCLDEFTDHGHCGLLNDRGEVDNDATLERYGQIACSQASAGADLVAPSGMMDGQVGAIRSALDQAGHQGVGILSYAAKYASAFYGPFRDAVEVTIASGGDRRAYQQDPSNRREALVEIALDVQEGADIVMVKPALCYLDVLAEARRNVEVPLAAYHVSGEYAMFMAGVAAGYVEFEPGALEILTSIKRAGADLILSYLAPAVAEVLDRS